MAKTTINKPLWCSDRFMLDDLRLTSYYTAGRNKRRYTGTTDTDKAAYELGVSEGAITRNFNRIAFSGQFARIRKHK